MHRRYYEGKPERIDASEEARADDEVARKILQLRTQAGLSQRELAKLVGTTASVICRLEDADYEGHSPPLLRRIAAALDRRVEIRFMPLRHKPSQTGEHGSPALGSEPILSANRLSNLRSSN
jgi:transcriptional regulator with XRE-family HTH domain